MKTEILILYALGGGAYKTNFNPPLVMVNQIGVLAMVTNCKSCQNLQVLFSLLQSVV